MANQDPSNLSDLVALRMRPLSLEVDELRNSGSIEAVMAASYSLAKAKRAQ